MVFLVPLGQFWGIILKNRGASFVFCQFVVTLSFDTEWSELMITSLNEPHINKQICMSMNNQVNAFNWIFTNTDLPYYSTRVIWIPCSHTRDKLLSLNTRQLRPSQHGRKRSPLRHYLTVGYRGKPRISSLPGPIRSLNRIPHDSDALFR
jgi:hypothetical protein